MPPRPALNTSTILPIADLTYQLHSILAWLLAMGTLMLATCATAAQADLESTQSWEHGDQAEPEGGLCCASGDWWPFGGFTWFIWECS